jgi:hypothetical protein
VDGGRQGIMHIIIFSSSIEKCGCFSDTFVKSARIPYIQKVPRINSLPANITT